MSKVQPLILGAVATLAVAELFHGPLGAAARLKADIEGHARRLLDVNDMSQIQAHLAETPMSRTLILSGPADDFQRGLLAEGMAALPGVARVEWDPNSLPVETKLPPGPPPENVLAPPVVAIPDKS
ncbi:hypothetical protein M8312_09375 [Sphingomonas sp. KRR8]|uniref:hypothetical protein n=1 Tax=Sphingomonas sp. KRR8 TaxID=2942996 RepID=UPI00202060DF|nr:hypothetical protein [Sphingomonas sp. KRR8]URD60010.1 hypothetical protein M8312_09375 [Sphingomonas sp. KRR8]